MKARVVANSIALALVAVLTPALAFAQASITGVVRDNASAGQGSEADLRVRP